MKQSTRVWNHGIPGVGSLYTYIDKLIKEGHTIISITPISYDIDTLSKSFQNTLKSSGNTVITGYKVKE